MLEHILKHMYSDNLQAVFDVGRHVCLDIPPVPLWHQDTLDTCNHSSHLISTKLPNILNHASVRLAIYSDIHKVTAVSTDSAVKYGVANSNVALKLNDTKIRRLDSNMHDSW